jgi:3-hydroxyisobutyrate dehydrogenase
VRVAFLGLGRMGQAMAGHVLDGGHELVVWNRTPGRAGDLVGRGATEARSVREAVTGADRVALMLFGPDAVREVLAEVVEAATEGTLVVDCTTVGPQDARGFARTCAERGLRYVDAPVAGSLLPAREGTLGVLAGASEDDFADAHELLVLWGDEAKVKRVGQVGAGSAMKLANNLALAFTIAGVGEALRLGHDLGLERSALLDVLAGTPLGGMVAYKRPLLDAGDYSDTTFSLELLAKDLGLAVDAADSEMPVTRAILGAAEAALDAGHTGEDFAVLAEHLADEGRADSY